MFGRQTAAVDRSETGRRGEFGHLLRGVGVGEPQSGSYLCVVGVAGGSGEQVGLALRKGRFHVHHHQSPYPVGVLCRVMDTHQGAPRGAHQVDPVLTERLDERA